MEVEIFEKSRRLRTARISLDMLCLLKLLFEDFPGSLPALPFRLRSLLENRAAALRV